MSEEIAAAVSEAVAVLAPAPEIPMESEELLALRERLRKQEKPWHLGFRALIFLVSLGAFIWFMRESGPLVIAVVVGVLAFHELGHFVAMKLLGYRNMNVFFVPFLGAAVSGRASKPGGWQSAVVSLAGPVPGLVLAAALFSLNSPIPLIQITAVTLVYVNALNLLPFVPLDGGRFMNAVLFSRHQLLEMVGTVVGVIGLVAVPDLLPGTPVIWAGVFVSMLIQRARTIEATARLRRGNYDFDGITSALPAESLWALHAATAQMLEKTIATERTHTSTMTTLHESAATRPARWHQSLGLFAVWAAALGLAWFTWDGLKHPRAHWQDTAGPAGLWSARFPSPVVPKTLPPPAEGISAVHQYFANSPLGEFGVTSVVLQDVAFRFEADPSEADRRMRAMVNETENTSTLKTLSVTSLESAGWPALQATFQVPSGPELHSLYIASGNAVHVLTTVRATSDDELTFRQSFQVLNWKR